MRSLHLAAALVLGWTSAAVAAPFAYIPNGGSNDVTVIDTATDTIVTTISGVGTSPETAVVSPDGRKVYVGTTVGFNVAVIDAATNTVTKSISVFGSVLTLARNPAGTRLFGAGGTFVKTINAVTETFAGFIATGTSGPQGVEFSTDGTRAYVTHAMGTGDGTVVVIDTATNAPIATVVGGGLRGIARHPDGTRLYTANGNFPTPPYVGVFDTATNTFSSIPLGSEAREVAVHPDGSRAYVSLSTGLAVVDTATDTLLAEPVIGSDNFGVDVHPDGSRLYMAARDGDAVHVIDTATNALLYSIPVGVDPYARGRFIGPLPVCGDGTVTFPEECDDGNTTAGDCCSPTCTYEAADTPCPDDGSLCTDDVCDGAGVCQHPAITCDDGDPCTADSCNPATGCVFADPPAAAKAKVVMTKLGAPAGDDKLLFKGEVTLVHPFAPPLDPVSNGARVVLTDSEGGSILDVTLPGGLYDPVLLVGWSLKGNGTKWAYDNKSPAPPGGVVKIKVQDKSATTPGLVKFAVKGKYGTYPLLPANIPVTALLALAPPAAATPQCAQASFPGPPPAPSCAMNNPTALKCK